MNDLCDCCNMREAFHTVDYDGWAKADHFCDYCHTIISNGDICGFSCEDWDEISKCYLLFGIDKRLASLLLIFVDNAEYDSILEMLICKDFNAYCRATGWIKRLESWSMKDH